MLPTQLKSRRMSALSTPRGILAALAIDQRKSLRRMIADASRRPLTEVADTELSDFKSAVVEALSKNASAVLLDPEFGMEAACKRDSNCGLLLAYESDGYENPRPNRMLALMPEFSVRRLRDLGADGIKILLSYTPFDDEAANDHKCAMVERIGNECEALGMPFFLEPVGYDPNGQPTCTLAYARRRPEIVIRSMEEFSKDVYKVDVLKVEFPVDVAFVEGSRECGEEMAYSRRAALDWFREADRVARKPYIYLSAGVSARRFSDSLRLASEAGARFSGVLCGRAMWQEGVASFANGGLMTLRPWLESEGSINMATLNECLSAAVPWHAAPSCTA